MFLKGKIADGLVMPGTLYQLPWYWHISPGIFQLRASERLSKIMIMWTNCISLWIWITITEYHQISNIRCTKSAPTDIAPITSELQTGNAQFGSKLVIFLSHVTLEFDRWPWKTIGHLFYAASSFVHHLIAIVELKLELQSGNTKFGSKSTTFFSRVTL